MLFSFFKGAVHSSTSRVCHNFSSSQKKGLFKTSIYKTGRRPYSVVIIAFVISDLSLVICSILLCVKRCANCEEKVFARLGLNRRLSYKRHSEVTAVCIC